MNGSGKIPGMNEITRRTFAAGVGVTSFGVCLPAPALASNVIEVNTFDEMFTGRQKNKWFLVRSFGHLPKKVGTDTVVGIIKRVDVRGVLIKPWLLLDEHDVWEESGYLMRGPFGNGGQVLGISPCKEGLKLLRYAKRNTIGHIAAVAEYLGVSEDETELAITHHGLWGEISHTAPGGGTSQS